jgi:hypothetical protein
MSALVISFIVSLLAANSGRSYDRLRKEFSDLNREAEYSVDLGSVETEFQRALQNQINKKVGDDVGETLSEAIDPWDTFVHELYQLETASNSAEKKDIEDHDQLVVKTEREVVDLIADTWIQIAENGQEDSISKRDVQNIVKDAYSQSVNQFHQEIAGTNIADETLLRSLSDIRERIDDLEGDFESNVYKNLSEFERLSTLFHQQPDYVPISANRKQEILILRKKRLE